MIRAKVVSFTGLGAQTGARIAALLSDCLTERYARGQDPSLRATELTRFAQQAMVDCDLIVFVGATGIAVRAVAPYLQGKAFDPAVVAVDEQGRFVIPLLSGHLGGANELALRIAAGLGAQPVVTTATDGRGVFAVDTWAKHHRCAVAEVDHIRYVSSALLRNETVGLRSAFPVVGNLPPRISLTGGGDAGFVIGFDLADKPFAHTLHLIPRVLHLGLGCRKGIAAQKVEEAVAEALEEWNIPDAALASCASIDIKKDEGALLAFAAQHALPFTTFSAEQLAAAPGAFTPSAFVQSTVGVDNVCERAAVCAAGGGKLLRAKRARDGVTVALAAEDWRVEF